MPYKRIDLVIQAFKDMPDKKLKVFGDGLDRERLIEIAGKAKNIEFLGRVSDEEKAKLYSLAQAYINPQKEDFGITIVEAMASGRPVIALRAGGAMETVIENKNGVFFDNETPGDIAEAVDALEKLNFDPHEIREHALKFSKANFKKNIENYINKALEENNI